MTSPHWPLAGLRLCTPRLEPRWPTLDDLDELATLAVAGVHDPQVQPFSVAWTDTPAAELPRRSLQYYWSQWAAWRPSDWTLDLVVVHNGTIVGAQGLKATDFAVVREVHTGSWIGLGHQGQGIGTEMRAAVLSLAFGELGAESARSHAHSDNAASIGVSRKLGYSDDGTQRLFLSNATVKTHINRIFAKTGARDRAQAVRYAYQHGMATRPSNLACPGPPWPASEGSQESHRSGGRAAGG
jgi:RimJ/RimL family protein N-acetyltransferase